MPHLGIAAIGAILLGLASIAIVGRQLYLQTREPLPTEAPSAQSRKAAAENLWSLYPALPDEGPETALFLLDESKRSYDGWIESNARIEAKATWLTGFLAGGAGLLTVFGGHGDKSGALQGGPFLWLALWSAFLALVCGLYVLRPKLRPHPEVSDYINAVVALEPKARFHIALSLAEAYTLAIRQIAKLRRLDPLAWSSAQLFLAVGVLAILVHFGLHAGDPTKQNVVQCHGQDGAFKSGSAWKTRCEEH